jgi:hypothetical protein
VASDIWAFLYTTISKTSPFLQEIIERDVAVLKFQTQLHAAIYVASCLKVGKHDIPQL